MSIVKSIINYMKANLTRLCSKMDFDRNRPVLLMHRKDNFKKNILSRLIQAKVTPKTWLVTNNSQNICLQSQKYVIIAHLN